MAELVQRSCVILFVLVILKEQASLDSFVFQLHSALAEGDEGAERQSNRSLFCRSAPFCFYTVIVLEKWD